ncbi:unnamed protein product [Bursaphelenchus xylophilus]|uniref:glutathione transferase n=1 Tax=Bursaphelenchus xylophilus TaxID=6326 RepID=A0A1I7RM15_BURXY|nr:unnamed protein product [Bursaphelenchus xylophilus]CAG9118111.1 unnamed protein product [Bursaphelenchus xylophilus]
MVHYKLWYFPVRNLAEGSRMVLHYANVPFEDFHIPFNEWPTTYKNKTPYGKIPVLEVNGKPLCESSTILRFLAKQYGLAGKNRWEKAKVDEILELHKSEYNEIMEWIMVTTGFKEGDKDRLFHTMAKPVCEHYFNIYHRILKENGSGFLVGKKPTAADFFVADYLHTLHNLKPELFEKHLDLVGFVKRIYSLPQLKAYIEKRPETPL